MRTRVILIVVLIIVIILAAVFFVTQQGSTDSGSGGESTSQPRPTRVVDSATREPTPTPIPIVEVVVAVQDIPRGVEIQPNMIEVVAFPLDFLPQGTFSDLNTVVGRIARTDISREQLIQARQVVTGLFDLSESGSDAAAILEAGRVAISLPIDVITSVAYALQPGDSVDVLVSMLFVDVDQDYQTILPNDNQWLNFSVVEPPAGCADAQLSGDFCVPYYQISQGSVVTGNQFEVIPINTGRVTLGLPIIEIPQEEQRPRLVTQRTVKDARVIWVGEFPLDGRIFQAAATPTPRVTPSDSNSSSGGADVPPTDTPRPPRPEIITLGVTPQDAVILTYMAEARLPMTFALRSARAVGLPETQSVTLDYIMTNFGIQVPDRFSFAVEPAIRSIRQLSLGNEIALQADAQP
ncbi:MAG: Flp pilus assembly protein CpaB [Anaerolineae bacterium]|nr:Flp pilus assembly protein CpaB [Anaerolineae bacterium]MDQ7033281.1 Flp pilus assembly protein CpaB [Anaerolineae bacterium]